MVKFRWENELKETDVSRIPAMWEVVSLGDVATIRTGKTNVQDAVKGGTYPLFDRSGIIKRSNRYLFDTEAVIVPGEGADFLPKYFKGKFDLHQRTYAIFGFRNLDGKFLFFAMQMLRHYLSEFAVGSTVSSLRLPIFQELRIPFPPLTEQSRIATVLSWIDDLIENKKQQNKILEEIAVSVFKSWFLKFDPFKDTPFATSPLGKIPSEWQVKPIGDLAELENGYPYSGNEKYDEKVEGSYLFVTLNNVVQGGGFKPVFSWIKSERLSDNNYLRENELILTNIHFGVGGSDVGRLFATPAIVVYPPDYDQERAVFSMDITKIIPFKSGYRLFLYLYLKLTREDSVSFSTGTSILHLDTVNFKRNKLIICPPDPILDKFVALIEPLFEKIAINQKQILVLRQLRDVLLPLLVFGKLRVEEI